MRDRGREGVREEHQKNTHTLKRKKKKIRVTHQNVKKRSSPLSSHLGIELAIKN